MGNTQQVRAGRVLLPQVTGRRSEQATDEENSQNTVRVGTLEILIRIRIHICSNLGLRNILKDERRLWGCPLKRVWCRDIGGVKPECMLRMPRRPRLEAERTLPMLL